MNVKDEICLPVDYVMERINENYKDKNRRATIIINDDVRVKKSIRVKTFRHKGVICAHCNAKPTYVRFRRSIERPDRLYFQIIGHREDGTQFHITVDHIVPKDAGGSNRIENLQPMCNQCNSRKGNKKTVNIARIYNLNEVLDDIARLYEDDAGIEHFRNTKKRLMKFRCRQHARNCAMILSDQLEDILRNIYRRYGYEVTVKDFTPRLVPEGIKL